MTNYNTLLLVCSLVGGVVGYHLRGGSSGQHEMVPQAISSKSVVAGSATSVSAKSGLPTEDATSSVSLSLADQMKQLLVDFDQGTVLKAVQKLSVEDLKSALALLASMPKSQHRDSLRKQLYAAWAATDPNAAWKAALADPPDKTPGHLLAAVAGTLAKTNPAAAIKLAMSLGMGSKRSTVMAQVYVEWSKVDVAAAIGYASAHPEDQFDSLSLISPLNRLAEKDPLKAANLAISFKDDLRRAVHISGLMDVWVDRDPAAALRWAQSQTNPQFRKEATDAAVGAWADADPAAALAFVQTISDVDARSSSFKAAWGNWFKSDPNAAASYLSNIKDAKLLESVNFEFSHYALGLSSKEHAALLALIPEGKQKEEIYDMTTSHQIREGQYSKALEMLNVMSDSTARDRNVAQLGEAWAKTDLAAASAWLKLQPDSTDRDLALSGYTSTLARTDPLAAIKWAQTIPDQKLRQGALMNIASIWSKADTIRSATWINGDAGFSASDKRTIQNNAKNSSNYMFN
ncbi:MAG: hypothetical protein NTV80_09480, partial [Verrucomicrobia bacterium]|nr:hypothetical protein [Verrucomicrobiota bacterium]